MCQEKKRQIAVFNRQIVSTESFEYVILCCLHNVDSFRRGFLLNSIYFYIGLPAAMCILC